MRRLTLSLLMVIGTLTSSFSQTSYPKRILWENDTVLAITKPQLVKINRSLNDYIHLRKTNELLQMDLRVSDSLIYYWKKVAVTNDTLYLLESKKFDEAQKVNGSLQQSLREQKKKSRIINIGVGVGGTLLGILLGVLLR